MHHEHECLLSHLRKRPSRKRWLRWFEGHTVDYLDNGKTLIVLTAVDQPALFGVINRIRDLGLELISVQKEGQVEK